MEVELRDLPEAELVSRPRTHRRVAGMLREIVKDEAQHGKARVLITYHLTDDINTEKGKASGMKQNLQRQYGGNEEVSGFKFDVARSTDKREEYLFVVYRPERIVKGKWEEFQEKKRMRKVRQKEMIKARVEARRKGEINGS